jgi:hypothetical protein
VISVLAAPNNFGDNQANGVAGPLALLLIVLLGLATWFLIRNMNARLRRLPREFPPRSDGPPAADLPGDAAEADDAEVPDDGEPPTAPSGTP